MPRIQLCICAIFVAFTASTPAFAEKTCVDVSKQLDAKIFTREECSKCIEARRFLYSEGIPFRELDAENPEVQKRLIDGSGGGTVPAMHVCGEWFFGFEEATKLRILRLFPYPT